MKLSAYHKKMGDSVEWYQPLFTGHCDRVYMSKVFTFSPEYPFPIDADEIIKGGTGYEIYIDNGVEKFNKKCALELDSEIEHQCPDYSLYGIKNKAYGFLTRGCPRGCNFCHVAAKEGNKSVKVADLSEFWHGEKEIILLDPNILGCTESVDLLHQLAKSNAYVDFCQGLDIRLLTKKKIEILKQIKIKQIHFAWDRYQDKNIIIPKLKEFKECTGYKHDKVSCYVLCNFDTTMQQNIERVEFLKSLDFSPYVMLYDKEHIPIGHELRKFQRYVNNRYIFWSCKSFKDYLDKGK